MQLMPDDAERDFHGYGATPPDPRWPGGARMAININLNYEAGGEHCLLEGDAESEGMLNDIGFPAYEGVRSPIVESAFEYGSRCGVWRLLRIFARFDVPVSILAVVRADAQSGSRARHGRRRPRDRQPRLSLDRLSRRPRSGRARAHRQAVAGSDELTGSRPLGWMTGRPGPNTRRLLAERAASSTIAIRSATNCPIGWRSAASTIS